MTPFLRVWLISLTLAGYPRLGYAQGYGQATAAAAIAQGERLLKSGRYIDAQAEYARAARAAQGIAALRAQALFGSSLAAQQASVLDSAPGRVVDSLIADYDEARKLDSAGLYAAASNNAGLLLRAQKQHRRALRYFLDAAATDHPTRAYFYLNAGQEYEQLGRPDSATALYHRALKVNPGYPEARQALLVLYGRWATTDSLLAVVTRWGTDPGSSEAVHETILEFLSRDERPRDSQAESLLVALTKSFAATRVSPRHFQAEYQERLTQIANRAGSISPGIAALQDAYRYRDSTRRYRAPSTAAWWRDSERRREVWSRLLRSLGDRHNESGATSLAASFYEAAVGYPETRFFESWIDLDAFLPLGVIYTQRASIEKDPKALETLNELIEQLFMGKGAAYEANDLPRIRAFHMTLGQIYANQRRWGKRYEVRGAIFQLDRMRRVTALMRDHGDTTAYDPPRLLEALAMGHQATGSPGEARSIAAEAVRGYRRLGQDAEAARVSRWIDRQSQAK